MSTVVSLADVDVSFGTNRVLNGVSLDVEGGTVVALVGANGAGKSTLIKVLSGVYSPDRGRIEIDGLPVEIRSPQDARNRGIQTVHQRIDNGIVPGMTVAENLVVEELAGGETGRYFSLHRVLPRARTIAASLDLHWSDRFLRKDVFELEVSNQQMLILARALSRKPRLLILDEPTSALSTAESERLFEVVRRLRAGGVAVLYVSHRLGEIDMLADELVVLRDGRIQDRQVTPANWNTALRAMLGAALIERTQVVERRSDKTLLSLRGVRLGPELPVFDLDLKAGEVTGVVGLLGAGKTELAHGIFGVRPFPTGTMSMAGRRYAPKRTADAVRRGVFLVPEDRTAQALIPGWSVARNLSLPFLRRISSFGVLRTPVEARAGRKAIDQFGIVASSEHHNVDDLSGGNQQKVVVARWLSRQPRLMLMHEPFRGVDIGARREIGRKARDLAAHGAAVVVFAADVDEILEVADRILVLVDGGIRLDRYTTETNHDEIIERMSEVAA